MPRKSPGEVYEDVEHGTVVAMKKVNAKSVILAYKVEAGVEGYNTLLHY
jgi:hypothetical protein